jgi:hypothetical protein
MISSGRPENSALGSQVPFVDRQAGSNGVTTRPVSGNQLWSAAPSKLISIVAALGGVTSRMNQCSACRPGHRVAPRDPVANGPSNSNSAGGSSQLAILVQ